MRALLLYGNAFSGHAFGLHGNLTPPRITPGRPPLLRRLTLSEWTLPDRFLPTAKSPLASPLLLSPSSHLTQREVLPCFNARHKESKECAVRFSCQRTLVLPKGQRTRGKGACLSRLYRNKNQISRGLSIKLFPKGLEFFSGELKRFFDAVLGNAFHFCDFLRCAFLGMMQ